jgi:hypothetical protein
MSMRGQRLTDVSSFSRARDLSMVQSRFRTRKHQPSIDPESLLRIPLVARALGDPAVRPTPRAVDCEWSYRKLVGNGVVGFNPFSGRTYHGVRSSFARWLRHRTKSARRHNVQDLLVKEVLFAVHDYLHIWAYSVLAELCPELRPGGVPLDDESIEAFAFLHIVTEACATVGLDYWYLATVDLNRVCDLGTLVSTLTVSYHERHLPEYRRFHPALEVQHPSFLPSVVDFYCSGDMVGFSARDLVESPRVFAWIKHELVYGQLQRKYIRRWLHHFAGRPPPDEATAGRAVRGDAPWQRKIVSTLSERLWALVKRRAVDPVRHAADATTGWRRPRRAWQDLAFVNLATLEEADIHRLATKASTKASFGWLFDQYVSLHTFERFDPDKLPRLRKLREAADWASLKALCRGEERVRVGAHEPPEIMLLG